MTAPNYAHIAELEREIYGLPSDAAMVTLTDLRDYLKRTIASLPPDRRQGIHWTMSIDWLNQCRALDPLYLDGPTGDAFIGGIHVEIDPDGGFPQIEDHLGIVTPSQPVM